MCCQVSLWMMYDKLQFKFRRVYIRLRFECPTQNWKTICRKLKGTLHFLKQRNFLKIKYYSNWNISAVRHYFLLHTFFFISTLFLFQFCFLFLFSFLFFRRFYLNVLFIILHFFIFFIYFFFFFIYNFPFFIFSFIYLHFLFLIFHFL